MIEVIRTDGEISINRNRNKGLWVRGNRIKERKRVGIEAVIG